MTACLFFFFSSIMVAKNYELKTGKQYYVTVVIYSKLLKTLFKDELQHNIKVLLGYHQCTVGELCSKFFLKVVRAAPPSMPYLG